MDSFLERKVRAYVAFGERRPVEAEIVDVVKIDDVKIEVREDVICEDKEGSSNG